MAGPKLTVPLTAVATVRGMSSALVTAIAAVVGVVLTVLAQRTGRKHDREQGLIEAELLAKLGVEDVGIADNVRASLSRRTERWARLPSADERTLATLNGVMVTTLSGVAIAALSWIGLKPESLRPILDVALEFTFLGAFSLAVLGVVVIAILTVMWIWSDLRSLRRRFGVWRSNLEPRHNKRPKPQQHSGSLHKASDNATSVTRPHAEE